MATDNKNSGGGQGGGNQGGRGSERGFAAMSAEERSAIASKGGKAAHQKGTAHEFTSEEARAAGRKGGEARSMNRASGNGGNRGR